MAITSKSPTSKGRMAIARREAAGMTMTELMENVERTKDRIYRGTANRAISHAVLDEVVIRLLAVEEVERVLLDRVLKEL